MEEEDHSVTTAAVATNKRRKSQPSPASEKTRVSKAPAKKRPSPDISQARKAKKRTTTTAIASKPQLLAEKKEKEPEEDITMSSDSADEVPAPPTPPGSTTSTNTSTSTPSSSEARSQPTNPSDALQQLLRRSGLEDYLSHANSLSRSKITAMIEGVKAEGDLGRQMESLMELCDYLSMGTEETLGGFRADSVVPALVNLLNYEDNPEIMLYAARALTYMMEALPASCNSVVQNNAIPIFCEKLLVISFIDVAEQSLQALDKLSVEHPTPILRAGGLLAVLSFLDFFSIGVKRSAVNTAANICRGVSLETLDHVNQVIPLLSNLLSDPDQKVVESACLCFARLTEILQDSETSLQSIASCGLLSNLLRLVAANPPLVNPATHTLLIRMITNIAHGSVSLALAALQEGIAHILHTILASDGIATRPAEHTQELLSLVNELLPPLPAEVLPAQIIANFSARPFSRLTGGHRRKKYEAPTAQRNDLQMDLEARIQLFNDHSHILQNLVESLFEVMVRVHGSTVNPAVRNKCLLVILKMLYYATSDTLTEVLRNIRISSFVAAQLASRDQNVVLTALKMADVLFEKLPTIFNKYFKREGVLFEVEKLSRQESKLVSKQPEEPSSPAPQKKAETKEPGSPSPLSPALRSSSTSSSALRSPSSTLLNYLAGNPVSPSAVAPAPTLPPLKEDELKSLLVASAKKFKTNFFGSSVLEEDLERLIATDELVQLRGLAKKLEHAANISQADRKQEEEELNILLQVKELVTRAESVSTFEFLQSQIAAVLVKYLSGTTNETTIPLDRRRQRWRTFCMAFSSAAYEESSNPSAGLLHLVRRLQDTINTTEKFQVLLHDSGVGSGSALSFLTQPLKLRLQKDPEDKSDLKDYSTNVVLIEPLATINAIEEFLWSRVKPPTPSLSASPSSASPLSLGDSKVVPASPTSRKELKSSTERAAKPAESPEQSGSAPSGDSSQPEDEYVDDYDEWDNTEEDGEDSSDQASSSVHDVKLTESGLGESLTSSASRPIPTPSGGLRGSSSSSRLGSTPPASSPSSSSSSSAAPQDPATKPHHLSFVLDNQPLPFTTTIFQAVQRIICEQNQEGSTQPLPRIWEAIYTLRYRLASAVQDTTETTQTTSASASVHVRPLALTPLDTAVQSVPPRPSQMGDETTYDLLALLRLLETLNRFNSHLLVPGEDSPDLFSQIPRSEFVSEKITAKLSRQLQDPLALCSGSLPDWCRVLTHHYSFLFPSESRRIYFNSTSFGIVRALHSLQQRNDSLNISSEQNDLRVGRISRQKVRVMRNRMLESAIKVMDLFAKSKAILEVEYFGEVGTGLGPTLEFYTCVSEELQRRKLKLWLDSSSTSTKSATEEETSPFVQAPGGLFPAPLNPASKSSELQRIGDLFKFTGSFVAKALLDSRILDMPFSSAFYKWMLGQDLSFEDLREIAPEIGRSLVPLVSLAKKARELAAKNLSDAERRAKLSEIEKEVLKCSLEDLTLDFTFPGQPAWELKENGSNISVTIDNLEEYVDLVTRNFLVTGVEHALANFRKGFDGVFPMEHLEAFTVEELDALICGEKGKWDAAFLSENIRCDHGYSHTSRAVEFFLDILSEFDLEQQRKFLLFVTGSPKLPVGGFKNLTPKLTIVRKDMQMESPDDYLPTVSSCFHYLKLPDYSSKEIMREKLLRAIELGQGSFHLT